MQYARSSYRYGHRVVVWCSVAKLFVTLLICIIASGTPLQNNVKELFTLLNFLFPDVIKNSKSLEGIFHSSKKKPQTVAPSSAETSSVPMTEEEQNLMMGTAVIDQDKVR